MKQRKLMQQSGLWTGLLALAVLSCSVMSDLPSLFATQTPTPTNTYTPSPTSTASPSPTATATQTPLPTGVKAEEQPDGIIIFTDFDNRYQLLLPPNWEIVFSTQKELQQAIQEAGTEDPSVAEMNESFTGVNPEIFRLAAMNVDRKYIRTDAPILLTINAYEDSMASTMPMAFVTAMIEDNILEGATSTTWDVIDNKNGVEVGLVRGDRALTTPEGLTINLRELVIAFQANNKLILMEIVAPQDQADEILATFENLIDGIEVNIQ